MYWQVRKGSFFACEFEISKQLELDYTNQRLSEVEYTKIRSPSKLFTKGVCRLR